MSNNTKFTATIIIIVLLSFGGLLFYRASRKAQDIQKQAPPINGIVCEQNEGSANHFHVHLQLLNDGNEVTVPSDIGVRENLGCLYWLHTHDSTGIIHIESPDAKKQFTLGQFFAVWGKNVSTTQAADLQVSSGNTLIVYVDGQKYSGNPADIVLKPHMLIAIETGKDVTPAPFQFPAGE